jgi:hypothetical protein
MIDIILHIHPRFGEVRAVAIAKPFECVMVMVI